MVPETTEERLYKIAGELLLLARIYADGGALDDAFADSKLDLYAKELQEIDAAKHAAELEAIARTVR